MTEILISTFGSRIHDLFNRLPSEYLDIRYLIVHQLGNEWSNSENDRILNKIKSRNDLIYLKSESIGLSNSRNILLENCSGEFCIFCDDDVEFNLSNINQLPYLFNKYNVDVIAGKMSSSNSIQNKYKYSQFTTLKFRDLLRVSSIEIAFRRVAVISFNRKFDTSFGLGATYPLGEEQIFLCDLLNAGAKISFYPLAWFEHPPLSSGTILTNLKLEAKGAMMARIKGLIFGIPYTLFLFFKILKTTGWRSIYLLKGHMNYSFKILFQPNKF